VWFDRAIEFLDITACVGCYLLQIVRIFEKSRKVYKVRRKATPGLVVDGPPWNGQDFIR
jgi:hypothetical protein